MTADADPTASLARAGRWLAVAVLTWLTFRYAGSAVDRGDGAVSSSFLHLPNLIFHEAGHVLFMPFGRFMTVLGGSLLQVLVPVVLAVAFLRQHGNRFAAAMMVWWAGQNLLDIAPYIADARQLQLTLIGGRTGGEVEGHDWEYLLTSLGWLHRDVQLGRATHFAGVVIMIAALAWAVWLLLHRRESPTQN